MGWDMGTEVAEADLGITTHARTPPCQPSRPDT